MRHRNPLDTPVKVVSRVARIPSLRILHVGAVCRCRHDPHGFSGRPHHCIPRYRVDVDLLVRARRIFPHTRCRQRIGPEILSSRGFFHGISALRDRVGLRHHWNNEFVAHRQRICGRGKSTSLPARRRTPHGRFVVQSGCRTVPHVGARCL